MDSVHQFVFLQDPFQVRDRHRPSKLHQVKEICSEDEKNKCFKGVLSENFTQREERFLSTDIKYTLTVYRYPGYYRTQTIAGCQIQSALNIGQRGRPEGGQKNQDRLQAGLVSKDFLQLNDHYQKQALYKVAVDLQKIMEEKKLRDGSGACFVSAILAKKQDGFGVRSWVSSLGDCYAFLINKNQEKIQHINHYQHSTRHPKERERVSKSKNCIAKNKNAHSRICDLDITGTIGDCHANHFLSREPIVTVSDLPVTDNLTLLLSSDAIRNVITHQEILSIAIQPNQKESHFPLRVLQETYRKGSIDNLSTIAVQLPTSEAELKEALSEPLVIIDIDGHGPDGCVVADTIQEMYILILNVAIAEKLLEQNRKLLPTETIITAMPAEKSLEKNKKSEPETSNARLTINDDYFSSTIGTLFFHPQQKRSAIAKPTTNNTSFLRFACQPGGGCVVQ